MAKNRHETRKRKSIISFDNLSEELKELFKEEYPAEDGGYKPYLQKTIKPNGEPIFSVPLETEDAIYMVKFEVKIDAPLVEEDLDKELFSEKGDEESELDVIERDESGETDTAHKEFTLKHGSYEDDFMAGGNIPNIKDELAEEFDTGEDEEDEDLPPEDDDMLDFEPDDDELMDIENELLGDEILTEKGKKKSPKAKETKKNKETKSKVTKETKASRTTKTAKEPKVKASKESKPKAVKEAKTVKEPKLKVVKMPTVKVKVAKEPKKTKKETGKK